MFLKKIVFAASGFLKLNSFTKLCYFGITNKWIGQLVLASIAQFNILCIFAELIRHQTSYVDTNNKMLYRVETKVWCLCEEIRV